ncbi:MAG: PEP-CTERM sorting domain-containing protein, partial [Thermoguttaceae bacterium]|nr:PEP-CTERM sorting domain-containing protein [Thermoguttaceae bacterium]
RFGSGIIYIKNGGISTDSAKTYIDNNIIATTTFLMRGTNQVYRGIVSLDNCALTRNSTVPTLRFENQLMGNGSINFTTTLGSGATISPGDTLNADGTVTKGIGTITITENGTLALEDGSILNFDVASKTSYDQIVFAAATTLDLDGATVNLNFTEDFDPTDIEMGDTFTLFGTNTTLQTDGASLRYDVSQLPETAQWMRFMLVPQGVQVVDGNSVPEPAAWVLLLLGGGLLAAFARSGKNKK